MRSLYKHSQAFSFLGERDLLELKLETEEAIYTVRNALSLLIARAVNEDEKEQLEIA